MADLYIWVALDCVHFGTSGLVVSIVFAVVLWVLVVQTSSGVRISIISIYNFSNQT